MIVTRFNLITMRTDGFGVRLHEQPLHQVPDKGALVNIGGNPYEVLSVGWALDDDKQYAFLRVQKARDDFQVTIGDTTY